jgi:predicted GNAT family acetyltransferase
MTESPADTGASSDLTSGEPLGHGPTRTREFEHLAEHGRFRMLVDGREVAVLDYRRLPDRWNIVHTFTDPAVRGFGVASDLVQYTLDAAREQGVRIVPTCPYVSWWVTERHPEYRDLIAD